MNFLREIYLKRKLPVVAMFVKVSGLDEQSL
jgi:hypothetical protein